MTVSPSHAEKNVWDTISDLHDQLNATFKSNQLVNDYALLNGFLTFVDSKLNRMIRESLQEQLEIYQNIQNGSISESHAVEIDDKSIPLILRLYWEKICYPIFKWFQAWRTMLLPKDPKEQRKYVEFRKMNSKLTKFFRSVHKFYYRIVEDLLNNYETSAVMPVDILKELNVAEKVLKNAPSAPSAPSDKVCLDPKSSFTVLVMLSLHSCLLSLGTSHRYRSLVEKLSNHYTIQDFKKSMRYLDLACVILPSIGEAHLQKGLIYVQTENLGTAVYEFTRSALARIPSSAGQANFANIISEQDSKLRKKFNLLLKDVVAQDLGQTRIVNREIIEFYFLAVFGSHFEPRSWLNPAKKQELQSGIRLEYLKSTLSDKMSTRYIKNIDIIFEDLIIVIGGFDLLLYDSDKRNKAFDIKTISLKVLKEKDLNYLQFAFRFSSLIINIVRESWEKNMEKYQYLAMVRVIECWLKSNRAVLQYSHRNAEFCQALAELLNEIVKSQKIDLNSLVSHRPKRAYYMKEDVDLKEFSTIKFAMTDFNDDHIFSMSDSTSRLAGCPPEMERLDASAESLLRLQAIFASGKKFLAKNSCGIEWNSTDMTFSNLPKSNQSTSPKPGTWAAVLSRQQANGANLNARNDILDNKKVEYNKTTAVSKWDQISRQVGPHAVNFSQRIYSGSSAPVAPSTFSIKPSSRLTEGISKKPSSIALLNENVEEEVSDPSFLFNQIGNKKKQETNVTSKSSYNGIQEYEEDIEMEEKKAKFLNSIFQSNHGNSLTAPAIDNSFTLPSFPYNIGFNSPILPPEHNNLPSFARQPNDVSSYPSPMGHAAFGASPISQLSPLQFQEMHSNPSASNAWMGSYPNGALHPNILLENQGQPDQHCHQQPFLNPSIISDVQVTPTKSPPPSNGRCS